MPHFRGIERGVAVPRVEGPVAEEPESRAVDVVRAAAGHRIDDSARGAPELGQVPGGDNLKLLHRVLRDLRADAGASRSFLVILIGRIVSVGEERIAERDAAEGYQPEGT